ncbi:MAG: hypothetical protein ABW079_15665 [Sedimenticola sp.]
MMRPLHLQVSRKVTRPGTPMLHVGGILLCTTLLSPLAMAQSGGMSTTLDKVRVVSTETHQFSLNTSTAKKIVNIAEQPEGRTISGEIACSMQTQAVLNNWYPFRYYMYKRINGQLKLINGGGLTSNKTYTYTATKSDEDSNAKYLFSAHLNHAQVTGQCSLTVKITEVVPHAAPQRMRRPPTLQNPDSQQRTRPLVPQSQKLQPIPRPPRE